MAASATMPATSAAGSGQSVPNLTTVTSTVTDTIPTASSTYSQRNPARQSFRYRPVGSGMAAGEGGGGTRVIGGSRPA